MARTDEHRLARGVVVFGRLLNESNVRMDFGVAEGDGRYARPVATLGAITGKRMRAIRRICVADKTNDTELVNRLRDPFLKISLGIRIALGLGIVLLMTAKPGLRGSIGIIGSSLVLGFLWSLLRSRRAPLSTASAGARD
jgi:hypothetical protein